MSAFAVALMITLSSYAACPCELTAPAAISPAPCCGVPAAPAPTPCCETPTPCCETPAPCPCKQKCQGCYADVINLDKACERNSFEVIEHSKKLSKFERLIKQASLEDYFECGNYIALVPTNCAIKCLKFKCPDEAKKFVLNHLADAKCYPNELCTYQTIKTLSGKEFCISQYGNLNKIGKSTVIVDNVKTKNGRIYVLDRKLK